MDEILKLRATEDLNNYIFSGEIYVWSEKLIMQAKWDRLRGLLKNSFHLLHTLFIRSINILILIYFWDENAIFGGKVMYESKILQCWQYGIDWGGLLKKLLRPITFSIRSINVLILTNFLDEILLLRATEENAIFCGKLMCESKIL